MIERLKGFPGSDNFCRLLIIFENWLGPDQARQIVGDQARQIVGPDLDSNSLTL